MGILGTTYLAVRYNYHIIKDKSSDQLVFDRDTIIPITHIAYWRCILQRKQAHLEKVVIHEISNWIKYDHIFGDQVLLRNKTAYKYETPFIVTYKLLQIWTNRTAALQTVAVMNRINIHRIKPYPYNVDVEWHSHLQENINIHI